MRTPTAEGLRRQEVGRRGEDAAADFLTARGYRVDGRNVRFRHGELDIVARDGHVVVFVEVKTRTTQTFGLPQEAVGGRKQARLRALAEAWLQNRALDEIPCRFDVVAVWFPDADPDAAPTIEHIIGAF